MKIQLSLLFLSLLAGKAAAFQSKSARTAPGTGARQNKTSKICLRLSRHGRPAGEHRQLRGGAGSGMPMRVLHPAAAGRALNLIHPSSYCTIS